VRGAFGGSYIASFRTSIALVNNFGDTPTGNLSRKTSSTGHNIGYQYSFSK
jgi:hypothetical protein